MNKGQSIILGKLDGKEQDVKSAARKLHMTPYWYYMGHKYNREWVRVLEAQEPVRIDMTLVDPVEEGVLIANPEPIINDKKMTWNLAAGQKLVLEDGRAKISLKRLNSYINVDKIVISPVE